MRTFVQKPNANQQATLTASMLPGQVQIGQGREVDSGFHLQRKVGNQLGSSVTNGFAHDFSQVPVCTKLPEGIQAKLKIGQPNDKYEQEADRVAEQVISMPDPQVATTNDGIRHKNSASPTIQRVCTECQAEEEERLQRKPFTSYTPPRISALTSALAARFPLQRQTIVEEEMGDENEDYVQAKASTTHIPIPTITPGLHTRINALKGTGQPLSPSTRAFFEPRFGRDYSQVRIHTDGRANDLASNINARAFTVGSDVVFGAGEYSSGTYSGRRLLAHELTHVVQQSGGSYVREIIAPPPFFSVSGIQGKQIGKILVQRQEVSVRSPVFEEAVTQYSTIRAATSGRPLTSTEIDLAKSVFGNSIDYNRVRFIPAESKALDWRTIGNTIREPKGYNIIKKLMHRRLFMHEMTHIWQYQHGGTKYISGSLVENSVAMIKHGYRNKAYGCPSKKTPFWECKPAILKEKSFFEYKVEAQASIVTRYFEIQRVLNDTKSTLSADMKSSLTAERDLLKPLILQMQSALPKLESSLLLQRASEVMTATPEYLQGSVPEERRMAPIKPLIEVRF